MNNKCPNCRLVNYPYIQTCIRCNSALIETSSVVAVNKSKTGSRVLRRVLFCVCICVLSVLGFYISLVASAKSLDQNEKSKIRSAIAVLRERGFANEVMLLDHFTVYRGNDNWLNASVAKENAYAATNFPFEIMTVYPDFFAYPIDDTERAAILLHEAQHLKGKDEHGAYEFVWRNRAKLGWTKEKYGRSPVWQNVRNQTRDNAPNLFSCEAREFGDCTE